MKPKSILISAVALLFFYGAAGSADELSDLKSQVENLEKKIEELEQRQQEQADDVEYILEQPAAGEIVAGAIAQQTNIGGHIKFFLADQTIGEVDGRDQHSSFAMGINDVWLYFSRTLTDWLKFTIAPQLKVVAEATPALGGNINRSGSASIEADLDEAYMSVRLPKNFELKVGAFYPMFSEEYATKSWWHEQYHNNNGLITLEAWKSFGLELYRNFDFAGFSLPVYFSLLNDEDRGLSQTSRFTDNNHAVNVLLHLAPEWFLFDGRLRVLGSLGYGRWDDEGDKDSYQWALGAEYTRSSLTFSGEYLYRKREDLPLGGGGTEDGTDKGWYLKAIYSFSPKWRFLIKYSDVELWSISTDRINADEYKALTIAAGWWITESSTIIPQIEFVDAERDGTGQSLEYWRYTLGWRTTF